MFVPTKQAKTIPNIFNYKHFITLIQMEPKNHFFSPFHHLNQTENKDNRNQLNIITLNTGKINEDK